MAAFDIPDNSPVVDGEARISAPWQQWVARIHRLALTLQQSGTTAQRPTQYLWVGRVFYDTTLGKPVWVHQVVPAVVWHDGSGAVV